MTFMTKLDDASVAKAAKPTFTLAQHGRAGLEFLGAVQHFSSGELRGRAKSAFEADAEGAKLMAEHKAAPEGPALRQRVAAARAVADKDPTFRFERFFQRWVAEENWNTAIPAIENQRSAFKAFMDQPAPSSAGGTLELADIQLPKYYDGVEWHLEPGGWDGYDLYGPVLAFGIGPLVFSRGGYAAVAIDQDIVQQRIDAVRQFPKASYRRFYEPGCGGSTTFKAINSVFPDAELVGCDLSPQLLKNGHKFAEAQGLKVHLKQRDCVNTGEPDESFDAVITYALHHEMPPKANAELLKEMYRIMTPGGDIVLTDPPPFRAVELFHAVILDWDTDNREEPFFSAVLLSSLDDQLREAGFENVQSYALGPDCYPWITRASKPAQAEKVAA
jgi:SAM-dependent methyltransferase